MLKKIVFTMLFGFVANAMAEGFYLGSTDIQGQIAQDQVFNSFGCSGGNISPQLSWKNAPAGSKSFAVTAYDPDAPTGSGWWHWVVFNIDPAIDHLSTGDSGKKMPKGSVESITSYGTNGFGGACPPQGDKPHRYIFTVYALNTEKIDLGVDARPELVGFYLNSHALAKASIMAYYGR